MDNEPMIDNIVKKLEACKTDGIPFRLTPNERETLHGTLRTHRSATKPTGITTYELTDRDLCPVIYMNVAASYPKREIIQQINSLIKSKADTDTIRHVMRERFGAVEITPEHVILPHIE